MTLSSNDIDVLTDKIIGGAIEVHRALGPGLLESVYRACLLGELREQQLIVQADLAVPVIYKGKRVGIDLRVDVLVDQCVVLELKAVERLHPLHLAQVITYLKLTGYPIGLLMNFNAPTLRAGLRRLEHPDRYRPKT